MYTDVTMSLSPGNSHTERKSFYFSNGTAQTTQSHMKHFADCAHTRMSSKSVPWSTFRNSWSHASISSVRFSLFSSSSGGGGSSLWWVAHSITLRIMAPFTLGSGTGSSSSSSIPRSRVCVWWGRRQLNTILSKRPRSKTTFYWLDCWVYFTFYHSLDGVRSFGDVHIHLKRLPITALKFYCRHGDSHGRQVDRAETKFCDVLKFFLALDRVDDMPFDPYCWGRGGDDSACMLWQCNNKQNHTWYHFPLQSLDLTTVTILYISAAQVHTQLIWE